jgi:hypothetical protein
MIRIDEIYQSVFWPWFQTHKPSWRVQFCDPFGRSDPDSVLNYGREDIPETNYTFFFDQEPIHLSIHTATFDKVKNVMNLDIEARYKNVGRIITSEQNSQTVQTVAEKYGWRSYYYFFHGWAALDWYRGYDKTFLITHWSNRAPTKTFLAPNRIIAGERTHRLKILYHIFRNNMINNYISCPAVCPVENVSIDSAVSKLESQYPDIRSVFQSVSLPLNFVNESGHPMHSCWLSLFDESANSLVYLVTETVASGHRHHLTEKTFKPIALGMPFVVVSTQGSLEYLKKYGFQTFDSLWDESYDMEPNDNTRFEKIGQLLKSLDSMSVSARQDLFQHCIPIIEHNWNHFYHGGFERLLWKELTDMLEAIDAEPGV